METDRPLETLRGEKVEHRARAGSDCTSGHGASPHHTPLLPLPLLPSPLPFHSSFLPSLQPLVCLLFTGSLEFQGLLRASPPPPQPVINFCVWIQPHPSTFGWRQNQRHGDSVLRLGRAQGASG